MSKQIINIGQSANDRSGDPLRTAFAKVNANFTELYNASGADVQIPAQAGHAGYYLTTNGTALSWGIPIVFPYQTGNAGKVLTTDGTNVFWGVSSGGGGGSSLTAFSVTTNSASGSGSLAYDNVTGIFAFTPPVIPTVPTYTVTTGSASGGGSLSLVGSAFTFNPASVPTVPTYTVTTNTASGNGSLSLSGSTFTFTPANVPAYSVSTTSASGGGTLSVSGSTFTFAPAVQYTLPTATPSVLGGVKIDNNSIVINNGVISVGGALTSATIFKGSWDASTNTPTLSNSLPAGVASGWEYIVSVAGTRDIGAGSTAYTVGDLVIYNGTSWSRIPGGNNVTAFNTRQGSITLTSSDVTTALGFTPYNSTNPSNHIALTGLSVTTNAASGGGSLSYSNTSGVFTFTPPNLSNYLTSITSSNVTTALGFTPYNSTNPNNYITLSAHSITTNAGSSTSALSYSSTTGIFSFTPYALPTASTSVLGGVKVDGTTITISSGVITSVASAPSITVTTNSASGGGALSYSSGVLTFTPANKTQLTNGAYTITLGSNGNLTWAGGAYIGPRGGAAGEIDIIAGTADGAASLGSYDLKNYMYVDNDGPEILSNNTNIWKFGLDGTLKFPNNYTFTGQTLTDTSGTTNYSLKIANGTTGSIFAVGTGTNAYGIANDALNNTTSGYVPYTVSASTITFKAGASAPATALSIASNGTVTIGTLAGLLKGTAGVISAATSGTDYAPGTSALATGIVKSTTTTGALTIAVAGTDYIAPYTSQTANTVLAAPNGSAGTPTFRALVAADIPSLTSAQLATILNDETGTGVVVFGTSPAITTSLTTASSSFDLINTSATTVNFAGAATTLSLGNTATAAQTVNMFTASTGASTYNFATGATLNATTKAINIGTAGVSGSTTNIALGSVNSVAGALGTITHYGNTVLSSGSLTFSGAISASAWTTSGIRHVSVPATLTDTTSTGTVANVYTNTFGGNTIAASNAVTFTNYATVFLNDPTAGTNVTITNAYSLITAGNVKLGSTGTGTIAAVAATATTSSTAASVGYIGMPQQSKSSAYTTVIGDAGKHIYVTATATITIDSNANVAYPIGTTIAFIAAAGATVTIAITTDTMYLGGTGTTGSRTLAAYGMATAVKVTSTAWFINGTGLT